MHFLKEQCCVGTFLLGQTTQGINSGTVAVSSSPGTFEGAFQNSTQSRRLKKKSHFLSSDQAADEKSSSLVRGFSRCIQKCVICCAYFHIPTAETNQRRTKGKEDKEDVISYFYHRCLLVGQSGFSSSRSLRGILLVLIARRERSGREGKLMVLPPQLHGNSQHGHAFSSRCILGQV